MDLNEIDTSTGSLTTGELEIDLYSDLTSFSARSPEEQEAEVERIVVRKSGISKPLSVAPEDPGLELNIDPDHGFGDPFQLSDPGLGDLIQLPEPALDDSAQFAEPANLPPPNLADDLFEAAIPQPQSVDLEPDLVLPIGSSGNEVICPACGAATSIDDLLCIACGSFVGEMGGEEAEAQNASAPIPAEEPATPTCEDCGEEVTPDEVFCPSCGAVLG
jgi:hypothetical protein